MEVKLRNKATGEIKSQKIGWSWTCFLFSPVLGIPLFIRRLNVWGAIMVVIWIVNFFVPAYPKIGIPILQIGFMIYFGIAANRMAGKNYLESGWEFAEPDSPTTATARESWGLPQLRTAAAN
jgi:hypothetical protein